MSTSSVAFTCDSGAWEKRLPNPNRYACLLRPDAVRTHAVLDDIHLVALDEAGVVAGSVPLSCQRLVRLWQGRLEHPYTRRQMAALPYCWSRPCASWKPSDKMTMRSTWTTKSSIARRQCIIHDGHQEGASTFKLSCFSLPGPHSVDAGHELAC